VIPVFWAVHVSKYCSGGFSESILASWQEFRNIGNAREFKVPALRAAKPVIKSRRVITNFIPPQKYSRLAGSRLRGSSPFFEMKFLLSSIRCISSRIQARSQSLYTF
jgi:hypothetical protein